MSAKAMVSLEGSIVTAVIKRVLVGFTRFKGFMVCMYDGDVLDWVGLDESLLLCGLKNCDFGGGFEDLYILYLAYMLGTGFTTSILSY